MTLVINFVNYEISMFGLFMITAHFISQKFIEIRI